MVNSITLKNCQRLQVLIEHPVILVLVLEVSLGKKPTPKEIRILETYGYWKSGHLVKSIVSTAESRKVDTDKFTERLLSSISAKDVPSKELMYFEIAVAFQERFLDNIESIGGRTVNIKKGTFASWVNPVRLMMEKDGITKEQLIEVWKFLKRHKFWSANVQSTAKLRDKFQTIHSQVKADEKRNSKEGESGSKVSDSYLGKIIDDLRS